MSLTDDSLASEASESAPHSVPSTEEQEAQVREKIARDLETWQEKFSKAADKGAEDLVQRVRNLTDQLLKSQVHGVGEAFVIRLEETTLAETKKLKNAINSVVVSLPKDVKESDIESAETRIIDAVRTAGLTIKTDAQSLRSWKENFIKETQSLISAAAGSTLDVLDSIRDLGLQEIGMRWAWMDGVTYKDWAKYHEMKETFAEWRDKVETVAIEHEGFHLAKSGADDIEGRGMAIAEDAAKELSRLKEVGLWKVQAVDDSDDFATRTIPAAAVLAGKKAASKLSSASENIAGTSQGTVLSEITQQAANAMSAASSKVVGTEPNVMEQAATKVSEFVAGTTKVYHESVVSAAKDKVSEALKEASDSVIGSSTPISESILSSPKSAVSDLSSAVRGTPQPKAESLVSSINQQAGQAVNGASEAILGTATPVHESVVSKASKEFEKGSSSISSIANAASQKVFAGAMAQDTPERIPVFEEDIDEEDSYPEKLQSVLKDAGNKYADITRAVSEAIIRPTSTKGSVESITSLAEEQYSSALAAASSVLYGTELGTGERLSKAASDNYAQAVSA